MNKINSFITIHQDNMTYTFLPTGDIFTISHGDFLVNQFRGNVKDGSLNNIYLRIYNKDSITVYPLLGIHSNSKLSYTENSLLYEGTIEEISYQINFRPIDCIWFWNISLNATGKTVDLLYGQDIGIGTAASVFTNEAYLSEYLGHSVFKDKNGYVICSRQNMPSAGCFPYIQQGVIGSKAIHYSTDGLQFFGLSYKETNIPEALHSNLKDYNLQYEFSYTALQTEKIQLNGCHSLSFYGMFLPDHKDSIREIEEQDTLYSAFDRCQEQDTGYISTRKITLSSAFGEPYCAETFTSNELDILFPKRQLEEYKEHTLLSFFTKDHAHVVTKEKERLVERPHGTIIMTPPDTEKINSNLIASTQYMFGIFNSHVVVGNTDLHKFLSTPRGFLNQLKNSGQRIYVRLNETYHLLTLPSLYEMGMNYSRWYYKLPKDILTITVYATANRPDLVMETVSKENNSYDFIITNQIVMGNNEYTRDIEYTKIKDGIRFELDTEQYPGLHYDLTLPEQDFLLSDDRIFFEEKSSYDETFLTIALKQQKEFRLIIKSSLSEHSEIQEILYNFESEKQAALTFYRSLLCNFQLTHPDSNKEQIQILNQTAYWYAHNAMIHFAMPHGLEQPGGAAWGTRDICQGPMEFFLATGNFGMMKQIILNIFSHQNAETMDWPQWFMFDRYSFHAGECHGDVIFWPLKSVADYILATGDQTILAEILPYDGTPVKQGSLLEHICHALDNIKSTRFIQDTGLITYAGGDWDDTLQPAREELKEKLVSSWTNALAYQTFQTLNKALAPAQPELASELAHLASKIENAFRTILTKDGVIAGFLEWGSEPRYMLHPEDHTTGIHYRLLPMTRSIIAELADPAQAKENISLIQKHLKCPDGVRLMDRPAHYSGGTIHLFQRAEQAANVGREISLQYTHAHIRYVEAMAKLGRAEEAWDSLFVVNPVLIQHTVKNAAPRQSNLYFSSSEGAYLDRYDYEENFHLLRSGDITVKGGWRLYSSGPGIYFRQLISNILGIRLTADGLILDPCLPKEMDGILITYSCFGRNFHFQYQISQSGPMAAFSRGQELPSTHLSNPYRSGGILIKKEDLSAADDFITIRIQSI